MRKSVVRYVYLSIYNMLLQSIGFIGQKLIGIIIGIFSYVLASNYLGMIRCSNVITSEALNNLVLSLGVWLSCILIGVYLYKYKIYKLFIRSNIPVALLRLMFLIELISFTSRLISLTIRLTANMIGGKVMLKLIGSLCLFMLNTWILPIICLMSMILVLEIAICLIQAYVFSMLSSLYLKDIINLFL